MALSNAERQARYKKRLKDAATPTWLIKVFTDQDEADAFASSFQYVPNVGIELFSRQGEERGERSMLLKLPGVINEGDLKGWKLAPPDLHKMNGWEQLAP